MLGYFLLHSGRPPRGGGLVPRLSFIGDLATSVKGYCTTVYAYGVIHAHVPSSESPCRVVTGQQKAFAQASWYSRYINSTSYGLYRLAVNEYDSLTMRTGGWSSQVTEQNAAKWMSFETTVSSIFRRNGTFVSLHNIDDQESSR